MLKLKKYLTATLMIILGTLGLSCSNSGQESATGGGESAPSAAQQSSGETADLPNPLIEQLPGWLGFATVSQEEAEDGKTRYRWSPAHPDGQAVIFSELDPSESEWTKVTEGARLVALTADGKFEATFLRASTERYGCEEGTTTMISFRASQTLLEGPVWLLPLKAAESAESFSVEEKPGADKNRREWSAGDMRIVLEKTGKYTAELRVASEGQPVRVARKIEKDVEREKEMLGEGEEVPPIALGDNGIGAIGVPEPVGAFRLDPLGPLVMILATYSFEGIHFEPLLVGRDTITEGPDIYVYLCAY